MRYDPIMCMMVPNSVKTKDANKNEGYKIHKAEIRGDKLYLTYTDLLYGGKETESFTKSEAKGFLTDPWNTWEGNTKSVMMKFVKDSASALDKAISTCDASKADMDYWVLRYEKGCKSLIDAIKQGRSPIKTVQKAKQVISQDYDSHWKYLRDAFASYVVSTSKEEAKGDLSGMIDNTSKVEKREWKEFADREKKLMKAKNDALKSAEQAFK